MAPREAPIRTGTCCTIAMAGLFSPGHASKSGVMPFAVSSAHAPVLLVTIPSPTRVHVLLCFVPPVPSEKEKGKKKHTSNRPGLFRVTVVYRRNNH